MYDLWEWDCRWSNLIVNLVCEWRKKIRLYLYTQRTLPDVLEGWSCRFPLFSLEWNLALYKKKILLLWLQASFSWFQCLLTASYTCAGNSAQCVANIVFRNSGNCLQKWKLPVLFLSQKKLDPTVWIEKLPLFNFKYFRFFFCRALKFVIYLFLVTPRMRTGEHLR